MRPTLFFVPHELFGIPVLGIGWVIGLMAVAIVAYAFINRKRQTISKMLEEQGVVFLVAAAIVIFLLPQIETRIDDGTQNGWIVGLPVRGYGVMLMLGVGSALSIGMIRCKKIGVSQEAFFSLATWVVIAGLLGARIFYVVQKWNELDGGTLLEKLWTACKVTEGGLVVYGSVIGGLIAMVLWSRKFRLPLLPIADAITPAFFVGLAFGRIGCLLNGCCYGGLCEQPLPSIQFPSGSPAYMDQMKTGKLLGMVTANEPIDSRPEPIAVVIPQSWASEAGITPGQQLGSIEERMVDGPSKLNPLASPLFEVAVQIDNRRMGVGSDDLPSRSLPVHPSQIYAAISGLLLCAWTFLLAENSKKVGVVFGAGLIAYAILRIIEEIIRVDEAGQFGTSLSIAQWISLVAVFIGVGLLARAKLSNEKVPSIN